MWEHVGNFRTSVPFSHIITQSTRLYFTTEEVCMSRSHPSFCHIDTGLLKISLAGNVNNFDTVWVMYSSTYTHTHTMIGVYALAVTRRQSQHYKFDKCQVFCVCGMRKQQLLMPNLILYLGMHYISGPYWLFVTDDVGYLLLCMLTSSPIFTV